MPPIRKTSGATRGNKRTQKAMQTGFDEMEQWNTLTLQRVMQHTRTRLTVKYNWRHKKTKRKNKLWQTSGKPFSAGTARARSFARAMARVSKKETVFLKSH